MLDYGEDINILLFKFLDYKSLSNLQQVNKHCLTIFIKSMEKHNDFLLNSIINSEYVKKRRRIIYTIRGKVKEPYEYIKTYKNNYLIGPCINQHNNNKKMITTKIMYLKTPYIKVEKLINFIHKYCNCCKFCYKDYKNNLKKIVDYNNVNRHVKNNKKINNKIDKKIKKKQKIYIPSLEEAQNKLLYFGKYKGQNLKYVYEKDKSYLRYLLRWNKLNQKLRTDIYKILNYKNKIITNTA